MKTRYTKEQLAPIVAASYSVKAVARALGLNGYGGGTVAHLNKLFRFFGLSTAHFLGRRYFLGKKFPDRVRTALQQYLNNEKPISSSDLGRRLRMSGLLDYVCCCCGLVEWQGKPLALHLDHVNGNSQDNHLENLRFMCPNCHSQTATYAGRNKRK